MLFNHNPEEHIGFTFFCFCILAALSMGLRDQKYFLKLIFGC